MENENKKHWDCMGGDYGNVWANKSKQSMHSKEMNFINKFFQKTEGKNSLDIGVGSGRIIENYLKNSKVSELYGIDISNEMVRFCVEKFKKDSRVKKIAVCNLSQENIPFDLEFDFISAIRVLKYNKNWKEMIKKIENKLSKRGIAVFTMPNKFSLNIFGTYSIPYYKTSKKEIKELCRENGLNILELRTFTRIPDVFYELSNNTIYSNAIIFMEWLLGVIFGKYLFGRMFFIAVKKDENTF